MAAPSPQSDSHHGDIVHDTQFDYYGRFLATCSSDRLVKVLAVGGDGEEHQLVATLQGHEGAVWMVEWAHPKFGVALASCSFDHKAIVWKDGANGAGPPQWKPSHIVTAHQSSVNAVAWAPHTVGMALATAGSDGMVYVSACEGGVWREAVNVAAQQPNAMAHPMGGMGVSWAPQQDAGEAVVLASAGSDASVKLWTLPTGGTWALAHAFSEHKEWVRDVAFSPAVSGKYQHLASCSQDGVVIIRRVARIAVTEGLAWETSAAVKFDEAVWRLSWSPCGTMLLATTADSQAFILKQGVAFADEWVRSPVSAE
jgi:protein transport protein SEC13